MAGVDFTLLGESRHRKFTQWLEWKFCLILARGFPGPDGRNDDETSETESAPYYLDGINGSNYHCHLDNAPVIEKIG